MKSLTAALAMVGGAMSAASLAAAQISVVEWQVRSVHGAAVADVSKTKFVIKPDGTFATTIGCNSMRGKAEISGSTLSIGPMAATRMACAPPLMDLESAYERALRASKSFRQTGDSLVFIATDGSSTIEFAKPR